MFDPFLLSLALKMLTSAAVVVAASLIVERSGPFLGAMVATLPISAGPSYVFLAYEHGSAFIERSSLASLVVNAATAGFIVVYAALAQSQRTLTSLGGALGAWAVAAWLVSRFDWSLIGALALNAGAYGGAILATRKYVDAAPVSPLPPNPWWTVPARAVGVMALVAVVILAGRLVGPEAAGIAALVPVAMTSLVAILHPRVGGVSSAAVLTNSLAGMIGFTGCIAVLHVSSVPFGSAAALTAALATSVFWNGGLALRRHFRLGPR